MLRLALESVSIISALAVGSARVAGLKQRLFNSIKDCVVYSSIDGVLLRARVAAVPVSVIADEEVLAGAIG